MDKALISLIVPCYNVEHLCDIFFQSLLNQTYTYVQLILVNDGSTDGTKQKLFSYKDALEKKGYIFEYIFQENKGLGGAVNSGLKKVKGDFLCWADPDDFYESNAFEVRINYFLTNPECQILTCNAYERDCDNLETAVSLGDKFSKRYEKKQFELLLNDESIFCSGCHMVRTSAMRKVNPNMDIYEAKRGQNWQLLLPLYYEFERHYLDVPVYNYVIYKTSLSHGDNSEELIIRRYNEHEIILTETLKRIESVEKEDMQKYFIFVKIKYLKLKMIAALQYKDKKLFNETYTQKQNIVGVDFKDKVLKLRMKCSLVNGLYNLFKNLIKS